MFERRIGILAALIGAWFLLIVLRLFQMQVVDVAYWREEGESLSRRDIRLPARRGTILDREGRVLAEDRLEHDLMVRLDEVGQVPWRCEVCGRPAWTSGDAAPRRCRCGARSFARVARPPLPEEVRARLPGVRAEFERAVDAEVERLERESHRKVRREPVERQLRGWWWAVLRSVGPEVVKEVELDPLRYRGFTIRGNYRRCWPGGDAVRYVVGVTTGVHRGEKQRYRDEGLSLAQIYRLRIGRTGLERFLEERLAAREGRRVVRRDRRGKVAEILLEEPARDGETIRTTLDLPLQQAAVAELSRAAGEQGATGGAYVALVPATGEVLALATWPPVRECGVQRAVTPMVPGSVFKVVTALAGLESGRLDPGQIYDCTGSYQGIHCHGVRHGRIDLEDAIRVSCNGYFAKAGVALGGAVLSEWSRRLGFAARTGIELPDEPRGVVGAREGSPEYAVRQIGFGQGRLSVTPLQVARLMAIVGNGGRMVRPTLLAGEGRPGEAVLSAGSIRLVRRALESVVTSGTARGVGLERFRAAGKTGTAELDTVEGNISWFAGYAPAGDPRVAFACYLEGARGSGGKAAGPVAAALLAGILGE